MSHMTPRFDAAAAFAAPVRDPELAERIRQLAARTFDPFAAPLALDRDYLVKGLLGGAGTVSVLRAPSNTGKSAVAVAVAAHVAMGEPLCGLRVRGGGVLYVAAEAAGSIRLRLQPWRGRLEGKAPFRVLGAPVDLRSSLDRDALAVQARAIPGPGIRLVVLDTLICSMGDGDENASRDMHAVVEGAQDVARHLGAHVMLVHHTGHQEGRMRGSSAILAAVDTELALERDREDPGLIRLSAPKQRDMDRSLWLAARLDGRVLGYDSDGDPVTTVEAMLAPGEAPAPKPARKNGAGGKAKPSTDWPALAREALAAMPAGEARSAADLAAGIPEQHPVRAGHRPDTVAKRVREALRALAADPASGVIAGDGGYRLVPSSPADPVTR